MDYVVWHSRLLCGPCWVWDEGGRSYQESSHNPRSKETMNGACRSPDPSLRVYFKKPFALTSATKITLRSFDLHNLPSYLSSSSVQHLLTIVLFRFVSVPRNTNHSWAKHRASASRLLCGQHTISPYHQTHFTRRIRKGSNCSFVRV